MEILRAENGQNDSFALPITKRNRSAEEEEPLTEYKESRAAGTRKKRLSWLGAAVILLLAAEAVIALTTGNRINAEEEALQAEAAQAVEATAPPAPMTLGEFLGVSPSDWELQLVRSDTPLPGSFAPAALGEIENGEMFDARAVSALRILIAEARADGYAVYVCSGYRSYETQRIIYQRHIDQYMQQGMTRKQADAATLLAVNAPGGSEHQLGLAADILEDRSQPMEPEIGGSGLMLWLEEHCADYGFIVRYPAGKTDITGVEYEPWHLRYVGRSAAYIMENGLCLEEFLDELGG